MANFSVGGGVASAKTFDLRVVSKTDATDHVFTALSKEEMQGIEAFLKGKNVRLKNEIEEMMEIDDPISEDDDDEDMSIPSEDEKPSKKDKKAAVAKGAANDEDESGKSYDRLHGCADKQKTRTSRTNRRMVDHLLRVIQMMIRMLLQMRVIR